MAAADDQGGQRQFIERYGDGRFHVSGVAYDGAVIVLPNTACAWPVATFAGLDAAAFEPVLDAAAGIDILLVGCGARMAPAPAWLRQACQAAGVTVDTMDTGAACRTFNVLRAEDRRVAAALLPV